MKMSTIHQQKHILSAHKLHLSGGAMMSRTNGHGHGHWCNTRHIGCAYSIDGESEPELEKVEPEKVKKQQEIVGANSEHERHAELYPETKMELVRLFKEAIDPTAREVRDVKSKVEHIDSKVGDVKNRTGKMEERLGSMEERLGSMEERLGSMEERLGSIAGQNSEKICRDYVKEAIVQGTMVGTGTYHKVLVADNMRALVAHVLQTDTTNLRIINELVLEIAKNIIDVDIPRQLLMGLLFWTGQCESGVELEKEQLLHKAGVLIGLLGADVRKAEREGEHIAKSEADSATRIAAEHLKDFLSKSEDQQVKELMNGPVGIMSIAALAQPEMHNFTHVNPGKYHLPLEVLALDMRGFVIHDKGRVNIEVAEIKSSLDFSTALPQLALRLHVLKTICKFIYKLPEEAYQLHGRMFVPRRNLKTTPPLSQQQKDDAKRLGFELFLHYAT